VSSAIPGDSQAALRAYEAARLRLARMRVEGGAALAETLGEIAETAARTLAVDRVSVWLLIDDRHAIRCYHLYERTCNQHSEGAVLRAADFPAYFRALEERRAIPAADAREDPVTHELGPAYLEPLGIVSLLDAPVYRGGGVIGVVCSESQTPRAWTAQERDFAASVADRVGTAFEEAARHDAEHRARDLEAAALDASRSEALGRVAAGIAHDFRNVLSVIVGFAHELRRSGAELPRRALDAAGEIERAAQRGVDLAKDLVGLGREEAHPTRVLDVADVVEGMTAVLRTALGHSHEVEIRTARPVGRVLADRTQIERVVLNLALNARDALPDGGTVAITVAETCVRDGTGAPGFYTVIEVADQGLGMDADTRARLFEPYFTTKPDGTGLGLAVAQRVVERCGGFLHVDSEPGRGTRIRVYLPRVTAED
jgi:two-component system cell cycle sensor histidine kinase/response regulator CckA